MYVYVYVYVVAIIHTPGTQTLIVTPIQAGPRGGLLTLDMAQMSVPTTIGEDGRGGRYLRQVRAKGFVSDSSV